jgi:hypothetical protein
MIGRNAIFLVVTVLLLTGSAVRGNQLLPGQTGVTPDSFANLGATVTILDEAGPSDYSFDGGLTSGQYEEFVASDSANTYCTGCLDFVFAFTVTDPNNSIESLTTSPFGVFETDGGYFDITSDLIDPTSMDRSASGGSVGFTFNTPVSPDNSSTLLVVETNATAYNDNGTAEFGDNNGATLNVTDFAPANAVPEPSAGVWVGVVVLVAGSFRRKLLCFPGNQPVRQ